MPVRQSTFNGEQMACLNKVTQCLESSFRLQCTKRQIGHGRDKSISQGLQVQRWTASKSQAEA